MRTTFLHTCAAVALAFAGSAWGAAFNPSPNARVRAMLPLPDGTVLVGGDFTQINGAAHSYVARLKADGSSDSSFLAETNDRVAAFAQQPDGKILIGGNFSQVNGAARHSLARLNADGSLDTAFASLTYAAGVGYAAGIGEIHLQADGRIIIVGASNGGFTSVGGQPRAGIARVNSDGSLDGSFVPSAIDAGESSPVFSAALQPDGKIAIGGAMANSSQMSYLARLNPNGSLDSGFNPAGLNQIVTRVLLDGQGDIVIAGNFSLPYPQLLRLHADGSLDTGYNAGTHLPVSQLSTIQLQSDGKLLIGGWDSSTRTVARLNADGSSDPSFTGPLAPYFVDVLALQGDGKVLIAGEFDTVGAYPRKYLARLSTDGSVDIPQYTVTPLPGIHGSLSPAAAQSVREGETTRFTILPDAGYHLDGISGCDGSIQGAYYVTGPITADCTITASFSTPEVAFTVTPNPRNGSLSPPLPQAVRFGQTASFTLTADPGYYLSTVAGCGGDLEGDVFTTAPISADCTIAADFVAPTTAVVTGGTPQAAVTGAPFATPLSVRVTSSSLFDDRPVAGVEVHFETPASGPAAILSSSVAITNADGEASVTAIANGTSGGYAVKAMVNGMPLQSAYFTLSNEAQDSSDLELRVTLSTEPPPACGTATSLDVAAGTPVNYCFTVVNHGPIALNYHTLTRSPVHFFWARDYDRAFYMKPISIPPAGSYRYNKVMSAGAADVDERFSWSALAETPRYAIDASATEPFVDISSSGTPVAMDDGTALAALPFAWNFYGIPYSPDDYHLCINNSGSIVLSIIEDYCPSQFRSDNGAIEATYVNGITPYWDWLGENGMVYLQTVGNAPNRRLIVQWNNKDHMSQPNSAGGITFEAIIEEGSSKISYVYRDLNFDVPDVPNLNYGGSATIGLFGNDVRRFQAQVNPPLHDGQAISWTPTPAPHSASAQTHLRVGTPLIEATPSSISATAAAGTAATRSIIIRNTGNLALEWSLSRAEASAHFPSTPHWIAPIDTSDGTQTSSFQNGATPSSSNGAAQNSALTIPAFGAMQEGTSGYPSPSWFVGFDAASPDYFVPIPTIAYNVLAGDFIRDDFTKEYIIYRDTDTLVSSIAIADLVDGGIHLINALPDISKVGQRWSGMAWDRTTNTLFASSANAGQHGQPCDQETTSGSSWLYTIDERSGQTNTIGAIAFDDGHPLCVSDIAISPGGLMYGIDLLNDALLAIDKTSGRAAVIGSLGVDLKEINSIDFDDVGGTLYLAAEHFADFIAPDSGGIYTIDLLTGLARRLAKYPLSPDNNSYLQVDALAVARAGGQCAFPGEISWLRTDTGNGSTAPGQQSPVLLTLDAVGLTVGHYAANVCISSNDRSHSLLAVPIDFTVTQGAADTIFKNGFDGAAP